jgi:hypothetical protein
MHKHLLETPAPNFARILKQSDEEVYARHMYNDKLAQAVKEDFMLIGKKLFTIKENLVK